MARWMPGYRIRVLSREPRGDAGAQVAPVRAVVVVPKAVGHEAVPRLCGCLGSQTLRGRGDENPKPGSDGTTTLKASVGSPPCDAGSVSSGSNSRYYAEGAGPAVSEHQRKRFRANATRVHEMHFVLVDASRHVVMTAEPVLKVPKVAVPPVPYELGQPPGGHAVVPRGVRNEGLLPACEPLDELVSDGARNVGGGRTEFDAHSVTSALEDHSFISTWCERRLTFHQYLRPSQTKSELVRFVAGHTLRSVRFSD